MKLITPLNIKHYHHHHKPWAQRSLSRMLLSYISVDDMHSALTLASPSQTDVTDEP